MLALSKTMPNQNPIVLLCWERSRRAPAPQALEIHRFRWPKLDALRLHCWQPVIPIFPCESLWHEKSVKNSGWHPNIFWKYPWSTLKNMVTFNFQNQLVKNQFLFLESWKAKCGKTWKNTIFCLVRIASNPIIPWLARGLILPQLATSTSDLPRSLPSTSWTSESSKG